MPRYTFPAGTVTNTTGAPLRLTFHATSTTGRRETDLSTIDGSLNLVERIANGVIVTTAASPGAYGAFAGPDDIDTLYLQIGAASSSRTAITATGIVAGSGGTYLNGTYARTAGIYVDNYGAVGDGTTDDTTAIQAAITATASGGTLIFGPKTYLHTGLTFTQSGLTIRGAGRGRTVLQLKTGTTGESFVINPTGTTYKNPFSISGLDVLGVTGSSHGIHIRYASVVNITDVRSRSHGGDGFRFYETTAITAINCEAKSNTGNGFTLGKKTDAGAFLACASQSNTGWGVVIGADTSEEAGGNGRVNGSGWMGCTLLGNTSGGIQIRTASTTGVRLTSCYLENNGTTANAQIGENGGSTVGAVTFAGCYFGGTSVVPVGVSAWNVNAVAVEDCFFEAHVSGGLKLNVASTPWAWNRSTTSTGYAVQDSASVNLSSAAANGKTIPSAIKMGPTDPTGTAEFAIDRSDTTGQMLRLVQAGAGTAASALLAVQADGTSTTQRAAFFRSKGTGSIMVVASNTGTVLDVTTAGRVLINNGPVITSGTATPEAAVTAPVGSLFFRTDGGAVTTLYIKESGSTNTGWRGTQTVAATGSAVLVGGTVTVTDANITANSIIRLASKTLGGTPGAVYISAKTASTSFVITSTSGTDTSTIQYYIDQY